MSLSEAEREELDRLVAAQAADLEWLDRVERHFPLATSLLWEAPAAQCDQRRAVIGAMQAPIVALVLGGWRSGKSEGLKQYAVASALGGDHPAVRAWVELNGLPEDAIPDGPQQVYAIAPSSNDSIRFHRPDFDRLIGPSGRWYNRNGKGEALLEVPIPGSKVRARVWFKAIDQGRKSFQGISIRYAWIDEEPLGEWGYGVYDELKARVADQSGRIGISMVPMEGITWVHDRLVRDHEDDARVFELDTLDNPHLPRASFERLFAGLDDDELAQRRHGRFRARSGAIYAWLPGDGQRFGPGHLCDDFEVPADWPRFRGADFGLVNATCVLWGALGDDGTLYVYREYYQADGESYAWHADQVAPLEALEWSEERQEWVWVPGKSESIEASAGDPAALEARDVFSARGLAMGLANNDVRGGIDRVRDRMRMRGDNRPRLKVFRSCRNLTRELPAYVWDPRRRDEVPLKKDDHAPDALRYLVQLVEEWGGIRCW